MMTKSWVLIVSLMAMVASFGGYAVSKKVKKQATMILSCPRFSNFQILSKENPSLV